MASDHPVFAAEIDYLKAVIEPLRTAVSVAEERTGEVRLGPLVDLTADGLTQALTVRGAVDAFLGKWAHGLDVIAEDAEEVADALQVSLTDFQESESRQALVMRQAQRAQQAADQERADSPLRAWVDDQLGHGTWTDLPAAE